MKEHNDTNKFMFVTVGLAVFVLIVAGFLVLLRENPETVVQDFFAAQSFDSKMMFVTPESAEILDQRLSQMAKMYGASLTEIKRERLRVNIRLAEPITSDDIRMVDENSCVVYVTIEYGSERKTDSGPVYLVRMGSAWRIDLTPEDSLAVF